MAKEFFEVHSSMTNTVEGSSVDVYVNTERICPNMTNAEFRKMFAAAQDEAVQKIEMRLAALDVWSAREKARVWRWFGRNDEATHRRLRDGLTKVLEVVRGFGPENVVRSGSEADHATGCLPNSRTDGVAAHVCAPDTATHTMAIDLNFCTMRPWSGTGDSQASTIIHEATHFLDTMATGDPQYTITFRLKEWGQAHPDLAIVNADSVAGYCVFSEN
ncbi:MULTISPECIES: M35 family metallo-endopeptidase [unclassified Caballeronia]|uniref:M35 family metallo-endopeptidase n=1 Tax=unclassified Caballeronia TaxID=2646786 RepID=UPI002028A554|nr:MULTISPECIES: M35 family metallo-endopeptidase [unclassified Caballeronia]